VRRVILAGVGNAPEANKENEKAKKYYQKALVIAQRDPPTFQIYLIEYL